MSVRRELMQVNFISSMRQLERERPAANRHIDEKKTYTQKTASFTDVQKMWQRKSELEENLSLF